MVLSAQKKRVYRSVGHELNPVVTLAKLVAALYHDLPDCAGVDRLHMLLSGSTDIQNVITFDFTSA